jgi:hypothetical protein
VVPARRDPENPTEVAYFNSGDVDPSEAVRLDRAWAHVRYVPETGHIWLATGVGGFWVLRLEGQVRDHLDLEPLDGAALDDPGAPGTVGVSLPAPVAAVVDAAPYFCTLSSSSGQV